MQQAPYDSFTYADPWTTVREHGENLEQELQKEIRRGHPLYGLTLHAIAQPKDCDDVLFTVEAGDFPYAVVHLTWTGQPERDPNCPHTQLYSSWEQWVKDRSLTAWSNREREPCAP